MLAGMTRLVTYFDLERVFAGLGLGLGLGQ
jgi:hypothetical protein